ncbi:MAG: hypothetical protein WA323_18920 [Candidatus Nitrosopolaris sp.]
MILTVVTSILKCPVGRGDLLDFGNFNFGVGHWGEGSSISGGARASAIFAEFRTLTVQSMKRNQLFIQQINQDYNSKSK